MGRRNRPFYRVVASGARSPRNGKFIETIGYYDPLTNPATVKIDEEKALKWLTQGAQVSETVHSLFKKLGILDRFEQARASQTRRSIKEAK
jgi:small subunit ribosomal protein S16